VSRKDGSATWLILADNLAMSRAALDCPKSMEFSRTMSVLGESVVQKDHEVALN
jgi:hypothetical protein